MGNPSADEPVDPRSEMVRQAQEAAQELMRTADLPGRLGWESFDFGVDPFDPVLDSLQAVVQSGEQGKDILGSIIQIGLSRHLTLEVRQRLMVELESRLRGQALLDVRQDANLVLRALQQIGLPPTSIGLIWALYPRHLMERTKERQVVYQREDAEMTAADHALVDALTEGKGDLETLRKLGERAIAIVDRVMAAWMEKPPSHADTARALCETASQWPGMRMARALTAVLWSAEDSGVLAAARQSLGRMPEPAKAILDLDLLLHDPPPEARRAMYAALVDLKHSAAVPRMAEDLFGTGPWSRAGKGADHARAILDEIVRAGDRRAIPMVLMLISSRPPSKEVREAVVKAFTSSPMKDEFERGLKAIESGRPVVVPHGLRQEEFFGRYGEFTDKMRPEKFQVEMQRVARLWEECYHEELGWRIPREVAGSMGPKERDLRRKLEKDVRETMGRMTGRAPVAPLQAEFQTKWLVTAQNDVSGRVPLAIILDERESRTATADEIREEREHQSAELYSLALRAWEAGLKDDAERYLRAILQIMPGHPFAKDALERVGRDEAIPGIGGGSAPAAEAPRIIIP